jgi:hypothetical protein
MLLLFWKALGSVVGEITSLYWYHTSEDPPRYLGGGDSGLTVINPYISLGSVPECCYFITPSVVNSSCIFQGEILAGTSAGVYSLSWGNVRQAGCDVINPIDLTADMALSYNTASGLPSDDVLRMDSLQDYLAIMTTSGLYWKKYGTEDYLVCPTVYGVDVCVAQGPTIYMAEQNQLCVKYGEPTDLSTWDLTIPFNGYQINKIFVNTYNGSDTVFIATTSGLAVWDGQSISNYYTMLSGSTNLLAVVAEFDARSDYGHVFVAASGGVNVLNLKNGLVENYLYFGESGIPAIGFPRFYSK